MSVGAHTGEVVQACDSPNLHCHKGRGTGISRVVRNASKDEREGLPLARHLVSVVSVDKLVICDSIGSKFEPQ